jgi:uncharacterized membrane protein YecN with MAPEG domain
MGDNMPVVTGFYLAILLLLYVLLSLQVSRYRRGNRVLFGDGDNIKLRSAIRAHANFAEYVPITVLMIAMLEMAGMPAGQVHWLMGVLLLSRLIHPLGLYVGPRTWQFQVCRVGGITLTLFVMVSAVISGLVWFWPR